MAGDFLNGLPSFNKENFTKFNADGSQAKSLSKRPTVYIQFKEETTTKPQVIITDKTNILLRYLRQQSDVKNVQQKRCLSSSDNPSPARKIREWLLHRQQPKDVHPMNNSYHFYACASVSRDLNSVYHSFRCMNGDKALAKQANVVCQTFEVCITSNV